MSDKIKKFIAKLTKQQLLHLLPYLQHIEQNVLAGIDVKPIKGHKGIYRARIGRYRIIFRPLAGNATEVLQVGLRDDQTYRDF